MENYLIIVVLLTTFVNKLELGKVEHLVQLILRFL